MKSCIEQQCWVTIVCEFTPCTLVMSFDSLLILNSGTLMFSTKVTSTSKYKNVLYYIPYCGLIHGCIYCSHPEDKILCWHKQPSMNTILTLEKKEEWECKQVWGTT